MVGHEWCHHIVAVMHAAHISEDGLVDAACEVETEVGVLPVAHIGEILVRHRLEDGTWHFRAATLGVVAVVEFTFLPIAIESSHILRNGAEQFVGEVA